jgi:hypothetical protein
MSEWTTLCAEVILSPSWANYDHTLASHRGCVRASVGRVTTRKHHRHANATAYPRAGAAVHGVTMWVDVERRFRTPMTL